MNPVINSELMSCGYPQCSDSKSRPDTEIKMHCSNSGAMDNGHCLSCLKWTRYCYPCMPITTTFLCHEVLKIIHFCRCILTLCIWFCFTQYFFTTNNALQFWRILVVLFFGGGGREGIYCVMINNVLPQYIHDGWLGVKTKQREKLHIIIQTPPAMFIFSPIGLRSSNDMRMCVCVQTEWTWSMHYVGIATYQFIP